MSDAKPPVTDTKIKGVVALDYAFQIRAQYEAPRVSRTHYGKRLYQSILAGDVLGDRIRATVHPGSGGNYDTVRSDGVQDVYSVFMLRAENGEWLYVEQAGLRRPDGYYKLIAYVDADVSGAYEWMNNTTFAVTATETRNRHDVVFTYYVAN